MKKDETGENGRMTCIIKEYGRLIRFFYKKYVIGLANIQYTMMFVFANRMLDVYRREYPEFIRSISEGVGYTGAGMP